MSVRKRGGRWHFDFMIRGLRYRGAIPEARTKAQALQAEVRIKQEIFDGRYGKPSGEAIFVKYAEDVFLPWSRENKRSYVNDEYHIETFKDYFGNKSFREITPMLLEKFKRDRRHGETRYKRERRPASVNRELQLLSKFFNLAIRDGLTDTNPCRNVMKLREDNQRNRYLLPAEEKRLLLQLDGPRAHLKPIVLLAIHTGMRRGEILKLRWAEVDFVRNLIYVTSTKSGKDRTVPLNDVARTVLTDLKKEANGSASVFVCDKTGKAPLDIKTGFARAREDSKIEGFRFHDLRHTFATRLADSGVDPFTIAELLGHADLRMTKRYTHATDQRRRSAVASLSNYSQEKNCHKIVTMPKRKAAG